MSPRKGSKSAMSNQITTQLIEEQNSEETMWENNGGVGDLALN